MLSDMSASRSRSHRPVFGGSWLLGRGSIVALITLSIITSLGISDLMARSESSRPASPLIASLKVTAETGLYHWSEAVHRPRRIQYSARNSLRFEITSWLESLVSALAHSQLARIARRCLS